MDQTKVMKALDELGIYYEGTYGKNESYVIELENDSEWGKIYSILESSNE